VGVGGKESKLSVIGDGNLKNKGWKQKVKSISSTTNQSIACLVQAPLRKKRPILACSNFPPAYEYRKYVRVTLNGVLDWRLDLLTIYR
jgi:hypothetical protein